MNWLRDIIDKIIDWFDSLTEAQKRLFMAIGLLIGAAIIGFLIYWVFFRSLFPTEETVNINGIEYNANQLPDILANLNKDQINVNEIDQLPDVDTRALGGETLSQKILAQDAQNVILSGDGTNLKYYDPETGRFYRVNQNGEVEQIGDAIFKGVEEVTWSNDTERAVLELEDDFNIVYDFRNGEQYTLNEDMEEFDFSPNDNQISYKYLPKDADDHWLGIANYDGSGIFGIEHLGDNEDTVNAQWSPSGQSIGTYAEMSGLSEKEVIILGFKGENFKKFKVDGRGFDYKWAPDGKQMLYSSYSKDTDYNNTLKIVDSYGDDIGKNNQELNIATSVDKCTFNVSGSTVYCAVPVDPPTGGAINPDKLTDVVHDIYKINLDAGTTERIARPYDPTSGTSIYAPTEVYVTDNESILYYTEAETGHIRRILLE